MNTYIRRFVCKDPMVTKWIDWRRPRDKWLVVGSLTAAVFTYIAVYVNEEKERNRRHTSIEKDIKRERWRARQLGLEGPSDDGFAGKYLEKESSKTKWMTFTNARKDQREEEEEDFK